MAQYNVQIVLGLLLAMAVLVIISRRVAVPYPVLLVLGGLALALVPGLPDITLDPNIVFLIFLPPLLYWESVSASLRDYKANIRPISLLAIGLVLATTCAIAAVAHAVIPGFSWPVAFVLGAILAPTDEAAVTEVAERLSIPRRVLTILEGESLVNDAISLVAYRMAVAAVITGTFSLWQGGLQFLVATVGAVIIGLAAGWMIVFVRRRLDDTPVEAIFSLLTPFAAYLPAEAIHASGVLAVVTTGLYMGWQIPRILSSQTRLQITATWQILTFLLNGLLFILTGLQLKQILHIGLRQPALVVVGYAGLILLTVIAVRVLWVVLPNYLPRLLRRCMGKHDPYPPWQQTFLIAWTGIRGGLSLVAALAIPITLSGATPFPDRSLIIVLSFYVILGTLLLQGTTLPWIIRRLKLVDDGVSKREEMQARLEAAQAAMAYLDGLTAQNAAGANEAASNSKEHDSIDLSSVSPAILADLRNHYAQRIKRYSARLDSKDSKFHDTKMTAYRRLRHALIDTERDKVIQLRDEGVINDDVLRKIQQDLDLEELRLGDPID